MSFSRFSSLILSIMSLVLVTNVLHAQPPTKTPAGNMQNQNGNGANNQALEPPKHIGSVKEIKTKGKIITLVIDLEGKTQEVIMTPKIRVAVTSTGDMTQLKEGVYFESKVNKPNDRSLIALELRVYPALKTKLPPGQIMQAPAMVGESKNNYLISGKIKSLSDKSAFEGYQDLSVQSGPQTATIQVPQKNFTIQVVDTDPAKIKTGDQVELEGNMLKNGKMIVSGVKVVPKS